MNLANVLRVNADNHGERTAIRFRDTVITYREALSTVRALTTQLHAMDVVPGDRVGLAMRDHPLHLLAHFAVAWLGAVIVPIDEATVTLASVRDHCREHIAGYKLPTRLVLRDAPLPRNATGKLQKHLLEPTPA